MTTIFVEHPLVSQGSAKYGLHYFEYIMYCMEMKTQIFFRKHPVRALSPLLVYWKYVNNEEIGILQKSSKAQNNTLINIITHSMTSKLLAILLLFCVTK